MEGATSPTHSLHPKMALTPKRFSVISAVANKAEASTPAAEERAFAQFRALFSSKE